MEEEKKATQPLPDLSLHVEGIRRVYEGVEQGFFENLRLFTERVLLYRITRVENKNKEFDFLARALREAALLKANFEFDDEQISKLRIYQGGDRKLQASLLFSTMVEATEQLDAKQLYYLLDKLRSTPIET